MRTLLAALLLAGGVGLVGASVVSAAPMSSLASADVAKSGLLTHALDGSQRQC